MRKLLALILALSTLLTISMPARATTTTYHVAVIGMILPHAAAVVPTNTQIGTAWFDTSESVADFYDEISGGSIAVTGAFYGKYTLSGADDTYCTVDDWADLADAAATNAGVDLSAYDKFAYYFGYESACSGWSGLATIGGDRLWINAPPNTRWGRVGGAAHEFGHLLGANHDGGLNCYSGSTRVAIASAANCTLNEYGSDYSVMGGGWFPTSRSYGAQQRLATGLLSSAAFKTVTTGLTVTLRPIELGTDLNRAIKIARTDGTYLLIEFRQPFGFYDDYGTSAPAVTGISLQVLYSDGKTGLIDTTPSTSTFDDANLQVGQTFNDVAGSCYSIHLNAITVNVKAMVDVYWSGNC